MRAGGQESDRARAPRVGSGRWGGEVAGSGVVNVEGRGVGWQSDSCVLFFAMNSLRASHHGQQKQQK